MFEQMIFGWSRVRVASVPRWRRRFVAAGRAGVFALVLLCVAGAARAAEEKPVLTLETGGHTAICNWLDFTPDGRTLVSLGDDKVVRLWDVSDPASPRLDRSYRLQIGPGHEGKLYAGDVSPDGRWLAVGGFPVGAGKDGHHIHVLDLTSGEVAAVLRGHSSAILELAFSPDGAWLASASGDQTLRVWDVSEMGSGGDRERGRPIESAVLKGHSDSVYGVAWVPLSPFAPRKDAFAEQKPTNLSRSESRLFRLVSGSDDDTGRVWERQADGAWKSIATLTGHTNDVREVACSPDGRWIATSSNDRSVRLWDADGRFEKVLGTKPGSFGITPVIDFSADSRWLVAADESFRGGAVVWSVPDGKQVSRFDGHDNAVFRAKFAPQSSRHAPRAAADVRKGSQTGGSEADGTRSVPAALVASAGGDANDIFLWDADTGREVGHIVGRGGSVFSAAFSNDGRRFAWGWENRGRALKAEVPLTAAFDLLEFRSSTLRVEPAAGGNGGQEARLGESSYVRGRLTSDGYSAEADAKNINTLIVRRAGQGGVARETARIAREFAYDRIRCYAFLPGRRQLVVGSDFGLTLHDADSGAVLREFVGHTGIVWAVAVSPDGRTLLSAGGDQTLRLWELAADSLPKPRPGVGAGLTTRDDEVVVNRVLETSPANRAGLKAGDVIKTVNGTAVKSAPELIAIVSGVQDGEAVTLTLRREGAELTLKMTPELRQFGDKVTPLLNFFFTRDGEDFVAWTDEGYYTASPNGDRLIGWHTNRGIDQPALFAAAWQYARVFNRPDVVPLVVTARSTQAALDIVRRETNSRQQQAVDLRTERDRLAVPGIKLSSPDDRQRVTGEFVKLTGSVTPTGSLPLVEVRVSVNGRPIPGFQTKGVGVQAAGTAADAAGTAGDHGLEARAAARTLDVNVPLLPGENIVEVVALTQYATTQPVRRHVFREAPVEAYARPSLYMVSVGVSKHENSSFDLKYADDDARDVLAAFKAQEGRLYQKVEGRLLLDEDVTERSLRKEMKWLRDSVTQHDLAVVFVSGHGVPDNQGHYYYVPHDFDGDPTVTGIPWTQFTEPLAGLPCKVLLLMDTCHSAGVLGPQKGNEKAARSLERSVEETLRQMTSIEVGLVVMTSSTGREESLEDSAWGHGAFALAVIEGIDGKHRFAPAGSTPKTPLPADLNRDGVLELKELDVYVTQRVREITSGSQHPVTRTGDIPSFPLAAAK